MSDASPRKSSTDDDSDVAQQKPSQPSEPLRNAYAALQAMLGSERTDETEE
jgi:hypothetical protein